MRQEVLLPVVDDAGDQRFDAAKLGIDTKNL